MYNISSCSRDLNYGLVHYLVVHCSDLSYLKNGRCFKSNGKYLFNGIGDLNRITGMPKSALRYVVDKDLTSVLYSVFT